MRTNESFAVRPWMALVAALGAALLGATSACRHDRSNQGPTLSTRAPAAASEVSEEPVIVPGPVIYITADDPPDAGTVLHR